TSGVWTVSFYHQPYELFSKCSVSSSQFQLKPFNMLDTLVSSPSRTTQFEDFIQLNERWPARALRPNCALKFIMLENSITSPLNLSESSRLRILTGKARLRDNTANHDSTECEANS